MCRMTDRERQINGERFLRLLLGNVECLRKDADEYNSTGNELYLRFIIEDTQKITEYANLLLKLDGEVAK